MTTASPHADAPHCPGCGYNLFGIDSEHCPECGLAIDRAAPAESRIPWTHRRRIGRIRAFFRTVVLRPERIAEEMNRSINFTDARKFRHVSILIAWLPTLALLVLLSYFLCGGLSWDSNWLTGCILPALGFWLYLFAITGLPGLFYHSRELGMTRQHRAIALSYYASASLMALPVFPILFTGFGLLLLHGSPSPVVGKAIIGFIIMYGMASVVSLAVGLFHGVAAAVLLKSVLRCSIVRCWATGLTLAVCNIVLFLALPLGIPWAFSKILP